MKKDGVNKKSANEKSGSGRKPLTNKKNFGGVGLFTAAALLSKLIGAAYRIPLTRILGVSGMGLYQSVFPCYVLAVTLCGGGLTAAVSKKTAESDGEITPRTVVSAALWISLPITALILPLCRLIATFTGARDAAPALAVLILSVPFSAVCAVFRGYFQGTGDMRPSAIGQLIEQSVKLAVGLGLAYIFMRVSVSAAVVGCAAGVSAGEFFSTLYYARRKAAEASVPPMSTGENKKTEQNLQAVDGMFYGVETMTEFSSELAPAVTEVPVVKRRPARDILRFSVPMTLSLLVLPACQVIDSLVVVNLLTGLGTEHGEALALYGLVTGPIAALVNMPAVLTVGLCAALLPKVSRLVKNKQKIGRSVGRVTAVSLSVGAVTAVGLMLCAGLALDILYGSSLGDRRAIAVDLLRLASFSVPCVSLMQTATAVLQGGGKAYIPTVALVAAAVVKETLTLLLLPQMGIYGFALATVVFYAVACIVDTVALAVFLRKTDRRIN